MAYVVYKNIISTYFHFEIDCGIVRESMDKAEDGDTDQPGAVQQDQGTHSNNDTAVTEAEPTREDRTLTDHLNRRLLEHFMQRLDGNDPSFPQVDRIDTSDPEEELNNGVHKVELNKN